jgi:hypothetical protein
MRVPATTGLPIITAGLETIKGCCTANLQRMDELLDCNNIVEEKVEEKGSGATTFGTVFVVAN